MIADILMLAAQTVSSPPPVIVRDAPVGLEPVGATSWNCEALVSSQSGRFALAGEFPTVSVEAQKSGDAFRLQTKMKSELDARLNGTFPAALTSHEPVSGISTYSVLIPGSQPGRPNFVLAFENLTRANNGFVKVFQIDQSSGAPSAYAAGVCTFGKKP